MPDVCLVFVLHHPERLRHVRVFDEAVDFGSYVDDEATARSLREAATQSFLPAIRLLRETVEKTGGAFRFALCPTGPFLRSVEAHHPALLTALQRLGELKVDAARGTPAVEWVAAPFDHSLLSILPGQDVGGQIRRSAETIERLMGQRPTTVANTELIYDNAFAHKAAHAGMKLALVGFADRQLAGRTANAPYRAAGGAAIKLLARHVGLSDDWGVRFSMRSWACHPLGPETFADWIVGSLSNTGGQVCPLFLHLADLGLTHDKDEGIFTFTRRLPRMLLKRNTGFVLPRETAERSGPLERLDVLDVPQATSGWGPHFDLSPWLGNAMQSNALHLLRQALAAVRGEGPRDPAEEDALLRFSAVDHLHHMRYNARQPASKVKNGAAGAQEVEEREAAEDPVIPAEQRRRPSPFDSPYDAYLDYTNALHHLLRRQQQAAISTEANPD